MVFYAFYVIAIVVLILHFTGWLKRNNLEWLILALAVSVFPVVIFLRCPPNQRRLFRQQAEAAGEQHHRQNPPERFTVHPVT